MQEPGVSTRDEEEETEVPGGSSGKRTLVYNNRSRSYIFGGLILPEALFPSQVLYSLQSRHLALRGKCVLTPRLQVR